MKKYVPILCLAWAGIAQAGWNSGGGELLSNSSNPWFLQNTREVTYCLEMDQTNFGQSMEVARAKVQAAIEYWKTEFQKAGLRWTREAGEVKVATQMFTETSCQQPVDLKFQFGTLTQEQEDYLKFPDKLVGVEVRTDYDEVNLRGKGFIYISPESGPLALKGSGTLGKLIPNRWQHENGKLLELVLIHELGHVFGLHHDRDDLMGKDFPQYVVSWPLGYGITESAVNMRMFAGANPMQAVFTLNYGWMGPTHQTWADILGIPADTKRLKVEPNGPYSSRIMGSNQSIGDLEEWGKITTSNEYGSRSEEIMHIYLTPAQRVLSMVVPEEGKGITGMATTAVHANYVLTTAAGLRKFIYINTTADQMEFSGVMPDGMIRQGFLNLNNFIIDWSRIPTNGKSHPSDVDVKFLKFNKQH